VTAPRALLLVLGGLLVLVVQTAVLARLPLPGGPPDLLVVVVVAVGLLAGPPAGMAAGMGIGLLGDLAAEHEAGRLALVLVVVGYLAGQLEDHVDESLALPVVSVAVLSTAAVVLYAVQGLLLGDPRVTGTGVLASLAGTVAYSCLLTPVVVPLVAALVRRADRRR
jgi:rod shape-determining protein MreD